MEPFRSSRLFTTALPDLAPVADDLAREFRGRGFEVTTQRGITGGWLVSLHKGGTFKAIVGLKTALNVEIEPVDGGTRVEAGIGIFGQQMVPTLVSALVFWPVLLTQVAGMVQNARLDDEAIRVAGESLRKHAGGATSATSPAEDAADGAPAPAGATFCTGCGARLGAGARYCSSCGVLVA